MKLIVIGANGFVAKEVIRQSLRIPAIDSVLAVSRSATTAPSDPYPNTDLSKFQPHIVEDYDVYNDETRAAFADADACIWSAGSSYSMDIPDADLQAGP